MRDRERWLITEQASNFDPKSVQNYLRTLYVYCFFFLLKLQKHERFKCQR